jgi:aspartate kinase
MLGAKVLHPRTIQPAVKAGIPLRVLNTFNIDNPGTLIAHTADNSSGLVKSVTWKKAAPLINVYSANMFLSKGFLQKIFAVLARNNISVNLLSASEVSVSVTLDNIGKLDQALIELNKFAKTDYIEGFGTVSLVGEQIMNTPSLMQDLFNIFQTAQIPVQMLSYSASNINISVIIPSDKINEVVPILHQKFISA